MSSSTRRRSSFAAGADLLDAKTDVHARPGSTRFPESGAKRGWRRRVGARCCGRRVWRMRRARPRESRRPQGQHARRRRGEWMSMSMSMRCRQVGKASGFRAGLRAAPRPHVTVPRTRPCPALRGPDSCHMGDPLLRTTFWPETPRIRAESGLTIATGPRSHAASGRLDGFRFLRFRFRFRLRPSRSCMWSIPPARPPFDRF